jgi:hypothetical protein
MLPTQNRVEEHTHKHGKDCDHNVGSPIGKPNFRLPSPRKPVREESIMERHEDETKNESENVSSYVHVQLRTGLDARESMP